MRTKEWAGEKIAAGVTVEEHTLEDCMALVERDAQELEALFNRAGKLAYQVKLANVGNPDFRQDSRRALPDTICGWVQVATLAEASEVCRKYIAFFDLGGGNWTGGEVSRNEDGLVVGYVSYNGRVWSGRDHTTAKEIAI